MVFLTRCTRKNCTSIFPLPLLLARKAPEFAFLFMAHFLDSRSVPDDVVSTSVVATIKFMLEVIEMSYTSMISFLFKLWPIRVFAWVLADLWPDVSKVRSELATSVAPHTSLPTKSWHNCMHIPTGSQKPRRLPTSCLSFLFAFPILICSICPGCNCRLLYGIRRFATLRWNICQTTRTARWKNVRTKGEHEWSLRYLEIKRS